MLLCCEEPLLPFWELWLELELDWLDDIKPVGSVCGFGRVMLGFILVGMMVLLRWAGKCEFQLFVKKRLS